MARSTSAAGMYMATFLQANIACENSPKLQAFKACDVFSTNLQSFGPSIDNIMPNHTNVASVQQLS
jgi:hypothetical protein